MGDGIRVRRVVAAAVGAGAVLLGTAAPAAAQPPNCSSADLAGVMTGVMASTTAYLYTHPPVNAFFTTLGDLDREQKRIALAEFLDANPQVKAELQAIRQPTADFRDRCGVQVPDMADS
ncbi:MULTISPECIES: heme-binding protein [Mycolicibacterium]|nr:MULTISPECIES: heme-binding protein [Mycolicibacterium]MCG7580144.1 heme-binding protein [Mycolicibacterium sp. OfavD-34-C]